MKLWKCFKLLAWLIFVYPLVFVVDICLAIENKNLRYFRDTNLSIKTYWNCIWIDVPDVYESEEG